MAKSDAAIRAERIHKATLRARNSWAAFTRKRERELLNLFDESMKRLTVTFAQYEKRGVMPPESLQKIRWEVGQERARLYQKMSSNIKRDMRASIDYGIETEIRGAEAAKSVGELAKGAKTGVGTSYVGAAGQIVKWDRSVQSFVDSAWWKMNEDAMQHVLRYRPTGMTFADTVWDVSRATQKTIMNEVNVAILQGDSAAQLSRRLRPYLNEPNRLYRRVRGKDGKLRLSKAARQYHPGRGVYRSSYKNAMRVARTEMGRAYQEGSIRYAMSKQWIDGMIWWTGSDNPCETCEGYAGTWFPKDEVPPKPHPHCMCWLQFSIKGRSIPDGVERSSGPNVAVRSA